MKKRVLAGMLICSMVFGLTACGGKDEGPASESTVESVTESTPESSESSVEVSVEDEKTEDVVSASVKADFQRIVAENEDMTATEVAEKLCENPVLTIGPISMPVEEGLLNGFGNTEITGFSEGCMFAPMIGAIPFIGYVFELKEDTDPDAFMSLLRENGDLAWNVCTRADEMVVERAGNKILFVMCPTVFED